VSDTGVDGTSELINSSSPPILGGRVHGMGLDVYVGSLTRYFAGDWKTIVQQLADRGELPPVQVIRPNAPEDAVVDPEQIRRAVLAWREGLSAALSKSLTSPLNWNETANSPYFTDKPAWDCYGALLLWSAYSEHLDLSRPVANPLCKEDRTIGDWRGDPAYHRSAAEGSGTRFGQILRDVETWLPASFNFTFAAPWVTGDTRRFGSSTTLVAELDDLNSHTWRAKQEEFALWRRNGADFGAPLETSAQFAFAILRTMAGDAVTHGLPMLLDY
jgi:hypothetical protein